MNEDKTLLLVLSWFAVKLNEIASGVFVKLALSEGKHTTFNFDRRAHCREI